MRRKDKEIQDFKEIEEIIGQADVCRVALSVDNVPYIVEMNFGYKNDEKPVLFFHSAREGRKIDIVKHNNNACFQMSIDHKLEKTEVKCNCSMNYRSVVGTGTITFVTDREEKIEALNCIMNHYFPGDEHRFEEMQLEKTAVLRLDADEISGKKCIL